MKFFIEQSSMHCQQREDAMTFSVPHNALIVIADGEHVAFYKNTATSGIKIEKVEGHQPNVHDNHASPRMPNETSPHEQQEANFGRHIADALYQWIHDSEIKAIVLIADPQTLGQLRPILHQEVTQKITGELHKNLIKASIADIEKTLTTAHVKAA
jgi:protein required for attachment to host cells